MAPNHMLFDLGNLQIMCTVDDDNIRVNRIGQQDCKDFFYCLDENRDSLTMTRCTYCNNVSQQDVSGTGFTIIELDCPRYSR